MMPRDELQRLSGGWRDEILCKNCRLREVDGGKMARLLISSGRPLLGREILPTESKEIIDEMYRRKVLTTLKSIFY